MEGQESEQAEEGEAAPNDLMAVEAAVRAVAEGDGISAALRRLDALLQSDDDNRIHFRSVEGFAKVLPQLASSPGATLDVLTKALMRTLHRI